VDQEEHSMKYKIETDDPRVLKLDQHLKFQYAWAVGEYIITSIEIKGVTRVLAFNPEGHKNASGILEAGDFIHGTNEPTQKVVLQLQEHSYRKYRTHLERKAAYESRKGV